MPYIESLIGYATGIITNPQASNVDDSQIGFISKTIVDGSSTITIDSFIGYTSSTIRRPHKPVGVKTASGVRYVSISVYDGTSWQ